MDGLDVRYNALMGLPSRGMWQAYALIFKATYFRSAQRPCGELFTQFCCTR